MKKTLLSLFLLLFSMLQANATHIVGGEIELQVVKNLPNATHRLSLNLYFDDINGNVGAKDPTVSLVVYRKRDNVYQGIATLPIISDSLIGFSNPNCVQNNSVRTRLIRYSGYIYLLPENFNDPDGYYFVWERCCRNNTITNIQSPEAAGSVFYLAFPALIKDGKTFENSSPLFGKLTGDYICRGRPFVFDFGATDADKDSLVYSLVTPLNGFSNTQNPRPDIPVASSNYPLVRWQTGYGVNNVIPGPQPLRVNSRTGQLSVTTDLLGLYVFCVLTEEFRNGKKIGEVRRDFQLKVIDCPDNNAPLSFLREKGKTDFYDTNQTITIKANQQKCLSFLVTDLDPNQELNLKILPNNFTGSYTLTPTSTRTNTYKDTLRAELCFDACTASFDGKPLIFDLIASDNGCPQPMVSTLRVKVIVEPDLNNRPNISTDLQNRKGEVIINQQLKFNLFGKDIDNDNITITAKGRGFNLADIGMNFGSVTGLGTVSSPFTWTPNCNAVRSNDYIVDFFITDTRCNRNLKDSISVNLKALPIPSLAPNVLTSLAKNEIEIILDGTEVQPINFEVTAQDPDADPIKLYALGKGFDLAKVGAIWTDKNGVAKIINPFSWKLDCSLLDGKDQATYVIDFITEDNSCSPNRFDTVSVNVVLKSKLVSYDSFKPVNVFTPNGDGKNEYFTLTDLPENNCFEKFEFIQIFDRWGGMVYESKDRNFRWTGGEYASAEYYYLLKFTKREFKGWVNLIR